MYTYIYIRTHTYIHTYIHTYMYLHTLIFTYTYFQFSGTMILIIIIFAHTLDMYTWYLKRTAALTRQTRISFAKLEPGTPKRHPKTKSALLTSAEMFQSDSFSLCWPDSFSFYWPDSFSFYWPDSFPFLHRRSCQGQTICTKHFENFLSSVQLMLHPYINLSFIFAINVHMSVDVPVRQLSVLASEDHVRVKLYVQNTLKTFYLLLSSCCIHMNLSFIFPESV